MPENQPGDCADSPRPRAVSRDEMIRAAHARVKRRIAAAGNDDEECNEDIRDLMRGPESAMRLHQGGGGGNRSTEVIIFRYCSVCDRQWKRSTVKKTATRPGKVLWGPVCKCGAEFVEKLGAAQLMGARSSGSGGGNGGGLTNRKHPSKGRSKSKTKSRPRDSSTRLDFQVPPAIDLLMEQSRGITSAQSLRYRNLLRFFALTREYEVGDLATWIAEMSRFDRERAPGRPGKFGMVNGIKCGERVPDKLLVTLTAKWGHVFLEDDDGRLRFERLKLNSGAFVSVSHIIVWAAVTYIWYLLNLGEKIDEELARRGLSPNVNRFTTTSDLRSSLAEYEILCELVQRHDDPVVKELREVGVRPPRAYEILRPLLELPL